MTKANKPPKRQVHIVLQGKGGVGKSVVASILAQYVKTKRQPTCIDTDPINPTFLKFNDLNVEHLKLLSSPNRINERVFDELIEKILTTNTDFIIDNGAGGFLAICNYIIENGVISVLEAFEIFIHVPITGGQAFKETAKGLQSIANQFDKAVKIVVWVNEFFGKLDKNLEDYSFYKNIKPRIAAKIILKEQSIDTFGEDIKMMFTAHKTFDQISNDQDLQFMVKRRLNLFKGQIFEQLSEEEVLCN